MCLSQTLGEHCYSVSKKQDTVVVTVAYLTAMLPRNVIVILFYKHVIVMLYIYPDSTLSRPGSIVPVQLSQL